MKRYQVRISKKAQKQIKKLQTTARVEIVLAIKKLADNPRPNGVKKLSGRDAWRIRSGDFRVIYEIFDDMVMVNVLTVGHRKEVYRLLGR